MVLSTSLAYADWTNPGAAYLCDSGAKHFSMKSVMDTSEPDVGTVAVEPGYSRIYTTTEFKCDLGKAKIRVKIEVDAPRATGTCAGFTHTYIQSMQVNGIELFRNTSFNNQCFSDDLYEIEILQNDRSIQVESCYATWDWEVGYERTRCDHRDFP